jgi:CheY-like chemotaxis protein
MLLHEPVRRPLPNRVTFAKPAKRVLLVEDDFSVAFHLAQIIDGIRDVRCSSTSSGGTAVEIASRESPDVALIDIQLSGDLNGVDTAIILRQALAVPTIFLSDTTDAGIIARARLADPVDVIWAPYPAQRVVAAVARHLANG